MTERALSFGAVAVAYEQHRLGYPDAVAETVLAYAGRPVRTALEIGAGTGKATRLFASRGIAVTATDPDPAMLAVLSRSMPAVVTRQAALEDLDAAPHDLVLAAACLHWTDPASRWDRVAGLLDDGGTFASFGGPVSIADPVLAEAVARARAPWVADDRVESPDGTAPDATLSWPGTELVLDPRFDDVRQVVIERRVVLTAADLVAQQATVSAYLHLPAVERDAALAAIRAVLPEQVEVAADVTVHLARLLPRTSPLRGISAGPAARTFVP